MPAADEPRVDVAADLFLLAVEQLQHLVHFLRVVHLELIKGAAGPLLRNDGAVDPADAKQALRILRNAQKFGVKYKAFTVEITAKAGDAVACGQGTALTGDLFLHDLVLYILGKAQGFRLLSKQDTDRFRQCGRRPGGEAQDGIQGPCRTGR